MKFISHSLPDTSSPSLIKLFDLCINLHIYIIDSNSMPISTITDTNSLFEFKQIISQIFIMIHNQLTFTGYSDREMQKINNGSLDFIIDMTPPFITKRWVLKLGQSLSRYHNSSNQSRAITNSLGILYYPQEYIPLYLKTSTKISVDYLIGQLLSIESDNDSILMNSSSYISLSLEQIYLNTSNLMQNYFSEILLIRQGKNHYSHIFTFQMNTTHLARNISLVFFDLPNSQKYLFTIEIDYNNSCFQSRKFNKNSVKYTVYSNLWQNNFFVYSIPIQPMSIVCAQVEILSKYVSIRNLKRIAKFLVVETGCYSFNTHVYEDYYTKVETDFDWYFPSY
jgi:hypothetical protein